VATAASESRREFELAPSDNARLANLCGPLDENLRLLESRLDVRIHRRGDTFRVSGAQAVNAEDLLRELFALTQKEEITPTRVHLALRERESGPPADADVRPAVEAGERLGFLPGDLTQKVDPYLRPMYDALYEMMGFDRVARFIERNVIEVAPLAFMRGRSLNDSFIILDEAQNTTIEQMKMFLTRIGFGSKAVVTGDVTQTDLPAGKQSGLAHVVDVLRAVEGVAFTFFDAHDVVRHPLVQRIVQAYESRGSSS
jgi:phosphate starvation-inducible protein PhoH